MNHQYRFLIELPLAVGARVVAGGGSSRCRQYETFGFRLDRAPNPLLGKGVIVLLFFRGTFLLRRGGLETFCRALGVFAGSS
jgi:hypothetical protein